MPYAGSTWNDLSSVSDGTDLLDSFGAVTPIDISWVPAGASDFSFSNSNAASPLLANYLAANVGFGEEAPSSRTVISDLEPSSGWNIALVSQGDVTGQGGTFSIAGEERVSAGS